MSSFQDEKPPCIPSLLKRDCYWAKSLSSDANGITATAEDFQVYWPIHTSSDNPQIGEPEISWLDSVSRLPGADRWADNVKPELDEYGVLMTHVVAGLPVRLRYIPPGSFLMGSPEDEFKRTPHEHQHQVTLTQGFWLGVATVSQHLWETVTWSNRSAFRSDSSRLLPIDSVSWDDCLEFFRKAQAESYGLKFTLPTEAQWEYACRAGTQTPFFFGSNITTELVNYNGKYPYSDGQQGIFRERTVSVCEFSPNPWGLYQMHGNVWEWCLDGMRIYDDQSQVDPLGPIDEPKKALRGGSWSINARSSRSASRSCESKNTRFKSIGFRIALVPEVKN